MEKTVAALPSSYYGYEAEGRLRGVYTFFCEGTAIPHLQDLSPTLGHIYIGVHQKDVPWDEYGDIVWRLVQAMPHTMFTIEQGLLHAHFLPSWTQQHERIRLIFRITGAENLVHMLNPKVEVKLDGVQKSVILTVAQEIDTTYLKDQQA